MAHQVRQADTIDAPGRHEILERIFRLAHQEDGIGRTWPVACRFQLPGLGSRDESTVAAARGKTPISLEQVGSAMAGLPEEMAIKEREGPTLAVVLRQHFDHVVRR